MASVRTESSSESGSVCISSAEYYRLVEISYQNAHLRQNLLKGGISENAIAILSAGGPSPGQDQQSVVLHGPHQDSPPATPKAETTKVFRDYLERTHKGKPNGKPKQRKSDWSEVDTSIDSVSVSVDTSGGVALHGHSAITTTPPSPRLERNATRSIQLIGLTDGVTHGDITAAVRGGQLLDVYMRPRDRVASISFVHAEDAKAFFARSRHTNLCIKGREVELRWNDRQFVLSNHVANRLKGGASRNLILYKCHPNHTEHSIRDDLEHIHNLVVIKVALVNGNCHIETNSVDKAIIAKSCMMSRLKYKGQRMDWGEDECSQPLATVTTKEPARDCSPRLVNSNNPFGVLSSMYRSHDQTPDDSDDSGGSDDTLR